MGLASGTVSELVPASGPAWASDSAWAREAVWVRAKVAASVLE
jgi:hypothetical protein